MSSKAQKRKADSAPAPQQSKKAKEQPAAAKEKQPQANKQGKKQGKKASKQPEPEPEPESDSDEEDQLPIDEAALAAIENAAPAIEKLSGELEKLDKAMEAEIYAVQKKFMQKRRPLLLRRDEILAKRVPGMWKSILSNSDVFAAQLDEIDFTLLDSLRQISVEEEYAGKDDAKQQILGVDVTMTFVQGPHTKAGSYKKRFNYDDATEDLVCVPLAAADMPFPAGFGKSHPDSFFFNWFSSEGSDDGVIAAQDRLVSELTVDPLQLYSIVAQGGQLGGDDEDDSDDDDDGMMAQMFGSDGDEDSDDEEAPQLVD